MNSNDACQDRREEIAALVLDGLDAATAEQLREHIAGCEGCRALYKALCDEEREIRSAFATIALTYSAVEDDIVERIGTSCTSVPVPRPKSAPEGRRTWRIVRIIVPLAAAAVLFLAAAMAIKILIKDRSKGEDNNVRVVKKPMPDSENKIDVKQPPDEIEAELKAVEQMFVRNDTSGLISILQSGRWESKIAAAKYLGLIGDAQAIGTLLNLVSEWQGPAIDNPFVAAIEQIKDRLKIEEPSDSETGSESPEKAALAQQPEFEFKPKGVLSGLVTDAQTSKPVTEARIRVSMSRIYTAETDANGFYSIDTIKKDGNYRIGVTSKEYVGVNDYDKMPIVNLRKDAQKVRHFKLQKACMIEVKVVNEAGEPIEGAKLIATSLADERSREIGDRLYSQKTDANGIIVLGGFEPSSASCLISAWHCVEGEWVEKNGRRYRESKWDYAPGKLVVKLNDPDVLETGTIVLKKGVEVQGYAEYADGVPAEGLEICPYPDWWHTNYCPEDYAIDANGLFTMPHITPGMYSIHIGFPHPDGGATSFSVMQTELPLKSGELLFVKVPRKSPQSLVSISGRITFITEKRPDHFEVSAYSPQAGHHHTNIGSKQDTFKIDSLEPGLYTVRFSGTNLEEKVLQNVRAPSSDLVVELEYMDKPKLTGTVVRADANEPVSRFRARARKLRTLRGPNYVVDDRWIEFRNSQGQFSIEVAGPGIYQVQIAADGFAWVWSEQINTDEGGPVTVGLRAGGSIRGTVVDEQGRGVAGARVIPLSKASGTMPRVKDVFVSEAGSVVTGAAGEFILKSIAAGSETLRVNHADYTFATAEGIEVLDGRATEGVEITLTKGGTVEGYVYGARGNPQATVTLFFQDASGYGGSADEEAGRLGTAITDANGYYRVTALPEQMCYVRRSNSGSSLGVVRRTVLPEDGKTVRLDFGGRPLLFGRVFVDGLPLSDTTVILGDVTLPYWGVHKCRTRTDSEGRFSFAGAPAGRYGIYYEQPGKRGEWIKIAVVETHQEDMDLGVIPQSIGQVRISLVPSEPNEPWLQGLSVYLQGGTRFYAARSGTVTEPKDANEPYIVSNVLPGIYTATVRRLDHVGFREPIELQPGQQELNVKVTIPKCTASIRGQFLSNDQQSLAMWRSDEKIIASIIPKNGQYHVRNLPAGDYLIGNTFMGNNAPLVEFRLAEGESKTLDLDTSEWSLWQMGTFAVQVVDSNGIPLTAAEIWLTGLGGSVVPVTSSSEGHSFVVQSGEYVLHAQCAGYQEAAKTVQVEAGSMAQRRRDSKFEYIWLRKR
jgi:protocatechuate 3,4-dioxygenase beta subunit